MNLNVKTAEKFNVVVENDRLAWLKSKYEEKVQEKAMHSREGRMTIDQLIAGDPTARPGFAGKYAEWIIKQYLADKEGRFLEDLSALNASLEIYNRLSVHVPADKRDINKISPLELNQITAEIAQKKEQTRGGVKTKAQVLANKEVETVYQDAAVLVRKPLTLGGAAIVVGNPVTTKWCIKDAAHWKSYWNPPNDYVVSFDFASGWRALLELKNANSSQGTLQFKDRVQENQKVTKLYDEYVKSGNPNPDAFYKVLAQYAPLRELALKERNNPKYADFAKKLMATDLSTEHPSIRLELAKVSDLTPEQLASLKTKAPPEVMARIMRYQTVSAEEFEAAIFGGDRVVQLGAASNPHLPMKLMQAIVNGSSTIAKVGLACNAALPKALKAELPAETTNFAEKTLRGMSDDDRLKGNDVILKIARGLKFTPAEVSELSKISPDINRVIARHQNIGEEDFLEKINSPIASVRLAVAQNKNLPKHLIDQIAASDDAIAKIGLTNNPNLSPKAKKLLMADPKFAAIFKKKAK